MLAPVVQPAMVERIDRVERGSSSTNWRVEVRNGKPLHLRLVPGGRRVAAKEVAVQRLVSPTVPVAPVLHEACSGTHPYYVALWIDDAVPLDGVLGEEQLDDGAGLGAAVGRTLAAIHQYMFERGGDLGEGLEVLPWGGEGVVAAAELQGTSGRDDVPRREGSSYARLLHRMLFRSRAYGRLGANRSAELWNAILLEDALYDWRSERACLVHFDFNPKNLLVRFGREGWSMAAVLDWEFAASADALFDVGNFLRHRADYPSDVVDGFIAGYRASAPWVTRDWLRRARFLDLSSQLEQLGSATEKPTGHRIAVELLNEFLEGLAR